MVMAITPVVIVGLGSGWNVEECNEGNAMLSVLAFSNVTGSTVPSQNIEYGIGFCERANLLKSSPIMEGSISSTFCSWKTCLKDWMSFKVSGLSFTVAGAESFQVISGSRLSGTPACSARYLLLF